MSCLWTMLAVATLALVASSPASASDKIVRIGVLAHRGQTEAFRMWQATAGYLERNIPGHKFVIIPLGFHEIAPAVQRQEVDFVIANTSLYVELEALYGVTRIATLKSLDPGSASTTFGGVIFCRRDRDDIRELSDIRGKTFMAVEENSFGGWRMAWREFRRRGIEPRRDFRELRFGGGHDAVVYAVRDKKVDAGTVRTDILENMAKEGKVDMGAFRILNRQFHQDFPFVHSTPLYPTWPLARLRHTDDALSQNVVVALMSLQPGDPAAKAAKIAGWTTPHDYEPVHEIMKELRVGPYKEYGQVTFLMVLDRYRYPIAAGFTFILLLIVFAAAMRQPNDRLHRTNQYLEQAHRDLQAAQSQLLQREKMASIGQLAAGVAHEINNPTGFIMSNLNSLQRYADKLAEFVTLQSEALKDLPPATSDMILERKKSLKIDYVINDMGNLIRESYDGAERIRKIVQDLKSFSHLDEADMKVADINAGLESTINIIWNELKYKAVVRKEYGVLPQVLCNIGQLNQVFLNLLVNAVQAIEKQGEITVKTWCEGDSIRVAITDTGQGISKENRERLFDPFFTTKEVGKGTGLGLSIAYDIVKRHNGRITVESEPGKGSTFTVGIPVAVGEPA